MHLRVVVKHLHKYLLVVVIVRTDLSPCLLFETEPVGPTLRSHGPATHYDANELVPLA